ncbi:MAG: orotate phosphoribosyltransferase [Candidatus Omnitrophota bacterium]|nr:MAG: orotate phosphoribosyltransferase [Candidatus Omnitrophota bacterium]
MKKKLLELIKKEAFIKKRIRLASGKMSNYYIDVRRVSLTSQGLYLISHLIWEEIRGDNIDAIGGPTLGADPIVSGVCMVSYQNKKNLKGFLIRKAPKKYGRKKMIEGAKILPQDRVVIVDDVATSGGSLIKTIEVLRKEKINVVKAAVVIDRQEGAQANFSKIGCPLISLFTKSDIIS